jgi:phosphoglycolate phosphatase
LSDNRFPDRRLFLFDIDGTLINTGGAGSAAMRAAFSELYGLDHGFRGIEPGLSDLAIIQDALVAAKVAADGSLAEALRRFKRAYYRHLALTLVQSQGRVLPGVGSLLESLSGDPSASVWLGTGNFRNSAGIKLRHYGLWHYFKGGGFGDRTSERALLIAQGIRTANRRAGRHGTVFVIGDTVHDIAAARANRAVAVGVATGTTPAGALEAAGADLVLESLEGAIAHFARSD